jgi:hypothetical protein
MSRRSELMIGFALVIAMGCGAPNAAAQTDKYPRMAAIGQYLMEKKSRDSIGAKCRSRFHIPRRDDPGSGTAGLRDSR